MKKFTFLIFILLSTAAICQNNNKLNFVFDKLKKQNEIYFSFTCENKEVIKNLSQELSISKITDSIVYAFANTKEFEKFLEYNLDFDPVYEYYNSTKSIQMASTLSEMSNWDRYPSHDVYEEMMQNFAIEYPELCKLDTIGFSVNNKPILCLIISDNVSTNEDEPNFFWSSTMHGNEVLGWVLMLMFADYLLSNYNTNDFVTNLVNNVKIYISPLTNPDGTYCNSSDYTSISQATRTNANGIDLNRNFPRVDGTSTSIEPEIRHMMNYAEQNNFVMAANIHAGAELINYPWDFATSRTNSHADKDWWLHVSWLYANLATTNGHSGYFTDEGSVTEGGDWYVITGSRQDYMNYFHNCKETTIEISTAYIPDPSLIVNYWDYNRQAILEYTEQILYGVRGVITDECTGLPISDVKIEIIGHDKDGSEVYSFSPIGNYHRLINEGTYNLSFSKPGYETKTIEVSVTNNNSTRLNVELTPVLTVDFSAEQTYSCNGEIQFYGNATSATSFLWNFGDGNSSMEINPIHTYTESGIYTVSLNISNSCDNESGSIENFIEIELLNAPSIIEAIGCEGAELTLTVQSEGSINWYETIEHETVIHVGNSLTNFFDTTTTYYIQSNLITETEYSTGANNYNFGNGSYYSGNTIHGMIFDAHSNFTLKSVKVNSSRSKQRTFTLKNSNNETVAETTVDVPNSTSFEVELNFEVPTGTGYRLLVNTTAPYLYRNSSGANYPYTIDNIISITHNTITDSDWSDYYYFFYDWKIETSDTCVSPKIPITATISEFEIDYDIENASSSSASDGAISLFVSGGVPPLHYEWSNGEYGSHIENLSHGTYSVTITDANQCSIVESFNIYFPFKALENQFENISISPNPSNGRVKISSDGTIIHKIEIINSLGQSCAVYKTNSSEVEINTNLPSGTYSIIIKTDKETIFEKITIF
ncbi:carboxypeptidase regulatory-like domain-containing protein [Bacteroidales bacterium OttesenSCG-928-I21]|nr:carboxypeptidase regulatory-like domain-containing protein [Bacteroidales bacterium OttesenSCG-928-I21]